VDTLRRAVLCALILLVAGVASAQPIGLNWSEQVNPARDSGGVLLDSNSTATVVWDKDKSGLAGWSSVDPVPAGDEVALDFSDLVMDAPFGGVPFLGMFLGSWSVDNDDGWTQDGEILYLLAHVPAAISSSGYDEYGVSEPVAIIDWPNMTITHDIVGGRADCHRADPGAGDAAAGCGRRWTSPGPEKEVEGPRGHKLSRGRP